MSRFNLMFFEEHYNNGVCKRELELDNEFAYEWDDYYEIQITPKSDNNKVCTQKLYYPDTLEVMKEGYFLKHGGLKIGKWRSYDKTGKLIEEIDEDEGWVVTWEELEPRLLDMKIRPNSIIRIERQVLEEDIYIWRITLRLSLSSMVVLTFSGKTGELLFSDVEQLSYG